jgi:hypothetical protein
VAPMVTPTVTPMVTPMVAQFCAVTWRDVNKSTWQLCDRKWTLESEP